MNLFKKYFTILAFAAAILVGAGSTFAAPADNASGYTEAANLEHHGWGHGPRGGCGW